MMVRRGLVCVVAAAVLGGCSGGGSGTPTTPAPQWSRERRDTLNTANGADLSANHGALKWRSADLGAAISTTPGIGVGGRIYVGTEAGQMLALDPADGAVVWTYTPGFCTGGDADGHACGVDADCPGTPVGACEAVAPIRSAVAIDAVDHTYFGTDNGFLVSLDANGKQVWCFDTAANTACPSTRDGLRTDGAAVHTSPLTEFDSVSNSTAAVFFGSADGRFFCLGGVVGDVGWEFVTGGPIHASPALDENGLLLVTSEDGYLYQLTTAGSSSFRFPLGSVGTPLRAAPAVGIAGVFQAGLLVGTTTGQTVGLGADLRTERWLRRFTAPLPLAASAALTARVAGSVADQDIVLVDQGGTVYLVNQATGHGSGFCVSAQFAGQPCVTDTDCGGTNGSCAESMLFDAGATVEAAPIAGSNGTIVIATAPDDGPATVTAIEPKVCTTGSRPTSLCRTDADCGGTADSCLPAGGSDQSAIVVFWTFSGTCVGGENNGKRCDPAGTDCPAPGTCEALGKVRASPAIATDGALYFGSDDRHVYAVAGGTA